MQTIFVNWYGPFTLAEVYEAHKVSYESEKNDKGSLTQYGLYAFTGKRERQRQDACLQYIGITTEAYKWRFSHPNHAHYIINRDKQAWLGKINNLKYEEYIKFAEHVLISLCAPPLNRIQLNLPDFECTVISKFFKKNMDPYKIVRSIIRVIPEVVIWDTHELRSNRKLDSYIPE